MYLLSPSEITWLIVIYGICLISIVWFLTHTEEHTEGFLAANRNVGVIRGALSIAVSWVWAPAIFISSMQSFTKGLPGIFWFTAPNILCFFVFTPLAIRLRRLAPFGYTLPEFMFRRFNGSRLAHFGLFDYIFWLSIGSHCYQYACWRNTFKYYQWYRYSFSDCGNGRYCPFLYFA